jgi:hypothetical protein
MRIELRINLSEGERVLKKPFPLERRARRWDEH